jgi:hypothetical protein
MLFHTTYIAEVHNVGSTLAYTNIGCLNMDHCLIINDCCLGFVLFYVWLFDVL